MSGEQASAKWDYLFVSDLHVALGYDPVRRAYHAREDFFFDEPFFRWLRWADRTCAEGRRWELIFAGDTFDFFPVDCEQVDRFFWAQKLRRPELGPADPQQIAGYWEAQFGGTPTGEQVPERIQRLLFEDDVIAGRIELEPISLERAPMAPPDASPVPEWAVEIHRRSQLRDAAERRGMDPAPEAIAPAEEEPALRVVGARGTTPLSRQTGWDEASERKYGFLPTPEKSASKMESIYHGHPLFFRALAWFVGRGHRVVFLHGNHDLEVFWPQVQERVREFVAREYPAAFKDGTEPPSPPDFEEQIDFRPGWFHYRQGVFYAEHGCQYEPLNSCSNPIRPLMPDNENLLNPDVGCLGVVCLHNHLESAFPEWENRGDHTRALMDLLRRHPFKMLGIAVRHAPDFFRMAQRLWLASKQEGQEPTEADFCDYAGIVGLEPEMVRKIHCEGDEPLLLRRGLAWLLFSPGGHAVKAVLLLALFAAAAGLVALWYLVIAPALSGLIPATFLFATTGPAMQLLGRIILWLVPPAVYVLSRRRKKQQYSDLFLSEAASRIHAHLQGQDPDVRYYIFGHDHRPDVRPVEHRDDDRHVYYLNTGSWTPWFAEGEQRLRTLGQEVQFTFARLTKGEDGYKADLLRWNDEAGRADPQMVPAAREEA
jgi:UDP-2,3-diacylglucosamine pyrophosphatase LpxH